MHTTPSPRPIGRSLAAVVLAGLFAATAVPAADADRTAPGAAEAQIGATLEAYRAAMQAKDIASVAALHVDLGPRRRAALEKSLAQTDEVQVTFSDLDVLADGDDAVVTFTVTLPRQDATHDRNGARELEVRISSRLVRTGDGWRFTSGAS